MTRYTQPSYCDPLKTERGYVKYLSPKDKRCKYAVVAIVAFGAGVAVCTLIQVYFGV